MMSYRAESHSEMDEWEEYLAKYILEDLHPGWAFEKHECPDLVDVKSDIGVEVTKAYPSWYNKSEGEMEKARILQLDGHDEAAQKHFEKASVVHSICGQGESVYTVHGTINHCCGIPIRIISMGGDLYQPHKILLEAALKKKLYKLNSGKYQICKQTGLFVFSLIDLHIDAMFGPDKDNDILLFLIDVQQHVLKQMVDAKSYQFVYVYAVPDAMLLEINLDKQTVKRHCVHSSKYDSRLQNLCRTVNRQEGTNHESN